jgi:hypothetical protein
MLINPYLLFLLPISFGFFNVMKYGVNVTNWDEWNGVIGFVDKALHNGIHLADFFAQHNEHRIFFPRLVFFINGTLGSMNSKFLMYISWLLMTISYGIILVYLNKSTGSISNLKKIFTGILIGLICFNIAQFENILWGFQLAWFMIVFFAILSFWFFYLSYLNNSNRYFIFSIVSAIIASMSSAQGLFVLPSIMGIHFLLFLSKERIHIPKLIVLIVSFVLMTAIYLMNYVPPGYPGITGIHIIRLVLYFFVALGSPLVLHGFGGWSTLLYSALLGFMLFLAVVFIMLVLLKRKKVKDNIFPLCLIIFGFIFCFFIDIGRIGLGNISQALSSRYITFSSFVITGLLLISLREFMAKKNKKASRFPFLCIFSLFIVMLIQNTNFSILQDTREFRNRNAVILLDYKNQPLDELRRFYPWNDIDTARQTIAILESRNWSVFHEKAGPR